MISVDRKVVEVAGYLYVEAPKNRKYRRTIYPVRTPAGYPLAERLAARLEQARAEQQAGTSPLGLVFLSQTGKHWRSSNFNRNVLQRAYRAAGWRDAAGHGRWTWHSLRHVFCTTTSLFTWKLEATDVSRMACRRQLPHHPGHVRQPSGIASDECVCAGHLMRAVLESGGWPAGW